MRQSKMTVLVGGDGHLFKECLPILQQTNKVVLHMGKIGTATIAKVISNMLAAVNNVTMGEAMMLGKKGGVDLKARLTPLDLAQETRMYGKLRYH